MESDQLITMIQNNYKQNKNLLENIKARRHLVVNGRSLILRDSSIIKYYVYNIDQNLRSQYKDKQILIDPNPHIIYLIKQFFNFIDRHSEITLYEAYLRALRSQFDPYVQILEQQRSYQQKIDELNLCLERERQRQLNNQNKYYENLHNITRLNERLEQSQIAFQENELQLSYKSQDIAQQQNIINELTEQINQIKNTMEEILKKNQAYNKQVTSLTDQLQQQSLKNTEQNQRIQKLNEQISNQQSLIKTHQETIGRLQDEQKQLVLKNQQVQIQIEQFDKQKNELEAENKQITDQIVQNTQTSQMLDNNIKKLQQQLSKLLKEMKQQRKKNTELSQQRDFSNQEIQEIQDEIVKQENTVKQKNQVIEKQRQREQNLKVQVIQLQENIRELDNQYEEIKQIQTQNELSIKQQQQQIELENEQIQQLEQQQNLISQQIQQQENTKQELQNQLADIKQKYQDDLRLMQEKSNAQEEQYKVQISNKSQEIYKQKQNLQVLEIQRSELDANNMVLQNSLEQQRIEGSNQIQTLQQQLNEQESALKTLINRLEQLSIQLQSQKQSLQQKIQIKIRDNENLASQIKMREQQIEVEIKQKQEMIQKKIQEKRLIETQVQNMQQTVDQKIKRNDQLDRKLQQLKDKQRQNEQQIQKLEQDKQKYEKQLTTFADEINDLSDQFNQHINTIKNLDLYGDKIQNLISEVGEDISKMEQIDTVGGYFYKLAKGFEYELKVDDQTGDISWERNQHYQEMQKLSDNLKNADDKRKLNSLISVYLYDQLYELIKLIYIHIQKDSKQINELSTQIAKQLKNVKAGDQVKTANTHIQRLQNLQSEMIQIIKNIYGLIFQSGLPGVSGMDQNNYDQLIRDIKDTIQSDQSGQRLVDTLLTPNRQKKQAIKTRIESLLNAPPEQFETLFSQLFKIANIKDKFYQRNQSIQSLVKLLSNSMTYDKGLYKFAENVLGKLSQFEHSDNSNILQNVIQRISINIAKPLANVVVDLKKLQKELGESQKKHYQENFTTRDTNNLSPQQNNDLNKFQNQLLVLNSILEMIV